MVSLPKTHTQKNRYCTIYIYDNIYINILKTFLVYSIVSLMYIINILYMYEVIRWNIHSGGVLQ